MNTQDLIMVGTIQKPFGLKGAVKVAFEAFFLEYTDNLTVLFVEERGNRVPYFIENLEIRRDNSILLKLEDVTVKEEAKLLNGKAIFVDASQYEGIRDAQLEEDYYGELIGLNAILLDADNLNIGKIISIEYLPQHECVSVSYQKKEVMLPLHDDIFDSYDDDNAYFKLDKTYLDIYFDEDIEKDD